MVKKFRCPIGDFKEFNTKAEVEKYIRIRYPDWIDTQIVQEYFNSNDAEVQEVQDQTDMVKKVAKKSSKKKKTEKVPGKKKDDESEDADNDLI